MPCGVALRRSQSLRYTVCTTHLGLVEVLALMTSTSVSAWSLHVEFAVDGVRHLVEIIAVLILSLILGQDGAELSEFVRAALVLVFSCTMCLSVRHSLDRW